MDPKITVDDEKISSFCQKWNIKEMYLFGSVISDDFRSDSDVDVLVKFFDTTGIGLNEWLNMIEELEHIFGRKVDLVSAEAVRNPFIRADIAKNRKLIHAA